MALYIASHELSDPMHIAVHLSGTNPIAIVASKHSPRFELQPLGDEQGTMTKPIRPDQIDACDAKAESAKISILLYVDRRI